MVLFLTDFGEGPGASMLFSHHASLVSDGGQLAEDSTPSSVWKEAQQTDGGSEVDSHRKNIIGSPPFSDGDDP